MDIVIRNARLRGEYQLQDVGVEGDRIVAVGVDIGGNADREIDAGGNLVTPGLVNAHLHLDKCMLGDVMVANESQTLQEAIRITWDHKRQYTPTEIADRAGPVVRSAIAHGTTALRGFADVDTIGGLTPVEGLLELKRRWSNDIYFEVVAFPQEGILRDPGCDALMGQAMELGADIVGGLPWYERTDREMQDHVDFCMELAERFDKDVHMLVDDTDDPNSRSLEYLAVRTADVGWGGRVTASHCGALASYDHTYAQKVIGLVAEAGITICSNSQISLVMDGRNDRGLVRRGTTRVKELLEAGVNVITAQDDVNDPYYPFGKPDQVEVAHHMAHVGHLTYPSELEVVFDMITTNAAKAMRLRDYGIYEGAAADLVGLGASTVRDVLRLQPPRPFVISGGRVVSESSITTTMNLVAE